MNTWIRRVIVAVIVVAVGYAGFSFVRSRAGSKKAETTYEFGTVTRGDIRSTVTATGVIQPWKMVEVKSNVGGRVDRLFVDLGDRVRAGQVIALIDPTDTKAAADKAEADLTAARAREDQARANLRMQEQQTRAQIAAATSAVRSAEARLAQAEASARAQPLLTESEIAQATASLESARKSVAQAEQSKRTLEQQLATLRDVTIPLNTRTVETNVDQARANLLTMESEYRRQRDLLAMGYVAKSDVENTFARLATMRATLETARQRMQTLEKENELQLAEMRSRIDQAQASIDEAQARVRQVEANLAVAETNRVQNEIRAKERDAAAAALEQSREQLRSARAELQLLTVRQREITAAKSQIVGGMATLHQAKINLEYTKIVAPRDGVVLVKSVEQGTVVPSSRQAFGTTGALLQLGDTSRLWVVCNVDETDIGSVNEGQRVDVRVDAFPARLLGGKVIRIDPQAIVEQNVTLIPVTVEIDMPSADFRPGMNAECDFIVAEVNDVLMVPNEAVKERDGVSSVQQLVDGKPVDVQVEVGLAGVDTTEIRSGIEEGAQVITKVIVPQKAETTNPFGGPFGQRPGGQRPAGGGGGGGGGRR
jgi:HlyD family secretion protein